nr:unnamed protein product [Callosobruchus analis]
MGSPLSPVVANFVMEKIEQAALETAQYKPKVWLRYVDDTTPVDDHACGDVSFVLATTASRVGAGRFTAPGGGTGRRRRRTHQAHQSQRRQEAFKAAAQAQLQRPATAAAAAARRRNEGGTVGPPAIAPPQAVARRRPSGRPDAAGTAPGIPTHRGARCWPL